MTYHVILFIIISNHILLNLFIALIYHLIFHSLFFKYTSLLFLLSSYAIYIFIY